MFSSSDEVNRPGFHQRKCYSVVMQCVFSSGVVEKQNQCENRPPSLCPPPLHRTGVIYFFLSTSFVQVNEDAEGDILALYTFDLHPLYLALCVSVPVYLCHDCGWHCDLKPE